MQTQSLIGRLCRHLPLSMALLGGGVAFGQTAQSPAELRAQVWATECAFARSMAQRDWPAFERLLSEQAVFFAGAGAVLHGKAEVAQAWKAYYEGAAAPFSWAPDAVEVLADGSLAYSTGPVRDAQGELVQRFTSVWRQEAPGQWRIVFDRGVPVSAAERERGKAPPAQPLCS